MLSLDHRRSRADTPLYEVSGVNHPRQPSPPPFPLGTGVRAPPLSEGWTTEELCAFLRRSLDAAYGAACPATEDVLAPREESGHRSPEGIAPLWLWICVCFRG